MKIKSRPRSKKAVAALLAIGLAFIGTGAYLLYTTLQPKPQTPIAMQPTFAKQDVSPEKKTPAQKQAYTVPPRHPRELIIPSLGIDANILPMSVLKDGSLEAPKTAWDVGWYNQSSFPGTGSGALLIDGHVNDALNSPGVFYRVTTLTPGTQMRVERGDGEVFTYEVIKTERKPLEQIDMSALLRSAVPGKEGLNLITCGGTYDAPRRTYTDRVLVFAVRSS